MQMASEYRFTIRYTALMATAAVILQIVEMFRG